MNGEQTQSKVDGLGGGKTAELREAGATKKNIRDIQIRLARGEQEYEQSHEQDMQVTCEECGCLFLIPLWQWQEDRQFESVWCCSACSPPPPEARMEIGSG